MERKQGLLTEEQATSVTGCGAGTESACFALVRGADGYECSLITSPVKAQLAGIRLGWRVNVDESDEKAWCPLGVLDNSKTE